MFLIIFSISCFFLIYLVSFCVHSQFPSIPHWLLWLKFMRGKDLSSCPACTQVLHLRTPQLSGLSMILFPNLSTYEEKEEMILKGRPSSTKGAHQWIPMLSSQKISALLWEGQQRLTPATTPAPSVLEEVNGDWEASNCILKVKPQNLLYL